MNIKLPAGKNLNKKDLSAFKQKIKQVLNQKLVLEQMVENKKIATYSKKINKFY